eukprot:TRINITY_DN7470_c0_g3_i1.p1 TRINITY_DN7470_c0_g3~~TRINITY_DN7470_c0_g3_i1.p1  ORF type:complete len:123 (-),score=28.48 TRINITY_DN7470_c0_g3_i1:17-385(-)
MELNEASIDMSPVDVVAATIVQALLLPATLNQSFNVVHPHPVVFDALFASLRGLGYVLQPLEYSAWKRQLEQQVEMAASPCPSSNSESSFPSPSPTPTPSSNALAPILTHFSSDWYPSVQII